MGYLCHTLPIPKVQRLLWKRGRKENNGRSSGGLLLRLQTVLSGYDGIVEYVNAQCL